MDLSRLSPRALALRQRLQDIKEREPSPQIAQLVEDNAKLTKGNALLRLKLERMAGEYRSFLRDIAATQHQQLADLRDMTQRNHKLEQQLYECNKEKRK